MSEKRSLLNFLFWVLLVVGIILVLWRIFGNSPSDFSIIITFTLMLMFKILSLSDELKDFKNDMRVSFINIKNDFNDIKTKLT